MGKWTKKETAKFIAEAQAEVAEDIQTRGISGRQAKFETDAHDLTLADIAEEEGHTDLAQPLRRKIGD